VNLDNILSPYNNRCVKAQGIIPLIFVELFIYLSFINNNLRHLARSFPRKATIEKYNPLIDTCQLFLIFLLSNILFTIVETHHFLTIRHHIWELEFFAQTVLSYYCAPRIEKSLRSSCSRYRCILITCCTYQQGRLGVEGRIRGEFSGDGSGCKSES